MLNIEKIQSMAIPQVEAGDKRKAKTARELCKSRKAARQEQLIAKFSAIVGRLRLAIKRFRSESYPMVYYACGLIGKPFVDFGQVTLT